MAVELQHQELICKHCYKTAPEGAKFCSNCGKKLPKPKEPIPDQVAIKQVDPVLKHAEAAEFLKCSEWMLYELGNQGKIPFFRVGNRRRYSTADMINWIRMQGGRITTAG